MVALFRLRHQPTRPLFDKLKWRPAVFATRHGSGQHSTAASTHPTDDDPTVTVWVFLHGDRWTMPSAEGFRGRKAGEGFDRLARKMNVSRGAGGPKAYPPEVQVDRRVADGEAKAAGLIHTSSRNRMPVGLKAHRCASQGLRSHEFAARESAAMRSSVTATCRAVRGRAGEAASRAPKSP